MALEVVNLIKHERLAGQPILMLLKPLLTYILRASIISFVDGVNAHKEL